MKNASKECEPVWCDAEDELFILYTSGSTGKPKVHFFLFWATADMYWGRLKGYLLI